jgi:hypothetical protein
MRHSFRFLVACALACGFALFLSTSPASATAPQVEESQFVTVHELFADCGDFQIYADGAGSVRITTYFNREGDPIRVHLQGLYNGTLTNSVTGKSILDSPSRANATFDLIAGTQTNVGAYWTVTVPGVGAVLIQAGRLVFDGDGPPVFIAGPNLPPDETIAVLCDALR